MWSETSSTFQTTSVVQPSPPGATRRAVTPFPRPFWITRSPWSSGVWEVVSEEVVNGRSQSRAPSAASTPRKWFWVKTTTCSTPPPRSKAIGDP